MDFLFRTVLIGFLLILCFGNGVLSEVMAFQASYSQNMPEDSTQILPFQSDHKFGNEPQSGTEFDFVISRLGMKQGLPQNSINDILQARNGYMWVATFGGLVRFDGHKFTTFNRSTHREFQFDRILKLHEDAQGGIWMMAENAQTVFIRYFEGKFTTYLIKPDQMSVSPVSMVNDSDGRLWISSFNKIYRFDGDQFVEVPVKKALDHTINDLIKLPDALITNDTGILITSGDSVAFQIADFSDYLNNPITHVVEHPRGSGSFFVTAFNDGIWQWQNGKAQAVTPSKAQILNPIFRFYNDKQGNLFGRQFGGMTIWNGSSFVPFYPFSEDENVQITNVLEDTEGNYWIGTFSKGLYKLRPSIISMIDHDQGLKNERILSLAQLHDGTILFGTNCGGFYEWKNQQLRYSDLNTETHGGCGWTIFQDSKQRIWTGTHGVFRTDNLSEKSELFMPGSWISNVGIFAITEDSAGQIWISTADGLARYNEQDEELRRFSTADGLYFNDARALFADESGVMWVGTKAGLNLIKNNTVERVELIEETGFGQIRQQPYIRAFYKDSTGAMWIGTYGDGIFRLKNGQINQITRQNGLFDDIVSHLVPDEHGFFWIGSNRGISRVRIADLNRFADGEISSVRSYSYGARDGMNSAETNGGFQPNHVVDSSGQIYFPTVAGIAVVSSNEVPENRVSPPVFIERVNTIDSTLNSRDEIRISHSTPYLEINYAAVNFSEPEKVRFKYKLIGLDDDWITVENVRKAIYSKIPAGDYRFQVIASNNNGVWNNTGASIAISVTPPFWQKWWFYSLSGILIIGAGGSIFYRRIQTFQKENERQKRFTEQLIESQEQERRRIANELHDSLGQQILVIKNRAEMAQFQIDDRDELLNQLIEITGSAMQSIENVRSISHGLRPVHLEKFGITEAIENLCDQIRSSSSIDWSYRIDNIDEHFGEKKDINFYRIIQEGTSNILRHSEADEASVFVLRTNGEVKAKLWDNGKGFNSSAQNNGKGLGFLGMYERTGTLGGQLDVQSEPGGGTTITLTIPIQKK